MMPKLGKKKVIETNTPKLSHFAETQPLCRNCSLLPKLQMNAETTAETLFLSKLNHYAETTNECQNSINMPKLFICNF
jgi:hypothetical protein